MHRPSLLSSTTLAVLLSTFFAATAAWAAVARFTPPAEEGTIFAVIAFAQGAGANQPTRLAVSWGPFHRRDVVGRPYGRCSGARAGIVLMVRHFKPDSLPFTLSTTGRIVRPPYQGEAPPEVGQPCFKLVKFRARY